jgi:Ca-activated chloride channel family protein
MVAFSFFIIRHKDGFLHIFDKKTLERLTISDTSMPMVARNSILLLALFFMLIALARPVIENGEQKISLKGLSAVVAVDISASMRAKDIYPNRLEFAKKSIGYLLDSMPHNELSLVAFSQSAFLISPFTEDKTILKSLINGVNSGYSNMKSTNLIALAEFASQILSKKEPKILILFSDGEDREDIEKFSKILKKEKITLYLVLVGTKVGSPIINANGKALTKDGEIVITKREDALGVVATTTAGAYTIAKTGKRSIEELVAIIKKSHKLQTKKEIIIYDREELFYYPLAMALFLLLIGFSSLPRMLTMH